MIKMIAAHDTNKGIGIDNKLPWHLPEDLAHFKRETEGKYVLMGRKTFESIGRPLPNRHSVVLTRDTDWPYNSDLASNDNFDTLNTRGDLLEFLNYAEQRGEDVIVIGGSEIYQMLIKSADELIITVVEGDYKVDSYFPYYEQLFEEYERSQHTSKTGLGYTIIRMRAV